MVELTYHYARYVLAAPDNCILTADSGSTTVWYAPDLRLRRGMLASVSGTHATTVLS